MAIIRRRDSPNSPLSIAKLGLLFGRIFVEAIGGVSDNGVKTIFLLFFKPIETIGVEEGRSSMMKWFFS